MISVYKVDSEMYIPHCNNNEECDFVNKNFKKEISVERIKEVLSYNPETGSLTWKAKTAKFDRTGQEAGSKSDYRGYRIISLDKKDYMAQRIAYILMTGEIPPGILGFKDNNPSNLKWGNIILKRGIKGYDSRTPEGRSAYGKAYRIANPEKFRGAQLQKDFGITLRQYEDMLIAQKGCCAICAKRETLKRGGKEVAMCVDHDHETSAIRSLLCAACNQGLGQFKDNADFLRKAADYLDSHKNMKISDSNVIPLKGVN